MLSPVERFAADGTVSARVVFIAAVRFFSVRLSAFFIVWFALIIIARVFFRFDTLSACEHFGKK